MVEEIWKDIEGFNGYQVSNLGQVRNLGGQKTKYRNSYRTNTAKTLNPWMGTHGYLFVMMPGQLKRSVHRLVAKAFCDGYFEGAQVNHKNGIRDDSRAANLEWVTASGNELHARLVLGKVTPVNKFKNGGEHINARPIIATNPEGLSFKYECARDAVREHDFTPVGIVHCCIGRQKTHRGWTFRYDIRKQNRGEVIT